MAFKKFQADKIFSGTEMLGAHHVLITNEGGVVQEIIHESEAGPDIQKLKGILTPGFINCHCHLELSHMKGLIPEKTGLVDFVFNVVTQRNFPEDEIREAIIKAETEMVQSGILAVGDICNNLSTLPQKSRHNLYYQNFIEASGWLPGVANTRFERSKSIYEIFRKEYESTSLVPHAPYSVSENLWRKLLPFFKNNIATIHNQESVFEDEFFKMGTGDIERMYRLMGIDNSFYLPSKKSSLQSYFHKFNDAASIILVHNTFTSPQDVDYANRKTEIGNQKLYWCLCVNANRYIENALPPVELFRSKNCKIILGTDSLASNDSLSILAELKTIRVNFPDIPETELFRWATINGAQALGISNRLGSFEKAKAPGVVLVENLEDHHLSRFSTAKRLL